MPRTVFDCSTVNLTQSESIHHYYILLHIIKIIFIFKSFTCTGQPNPIDPGCFKLASRNLVGLPILMPLIDTNWLLLVQDDSEVNSYLSQVLVEYWSGSRPAHGKQWNNSIKKLLLGSADGPATPAAGKVSWMAAAAQARKKLKWVFKVCLIFSGSKEY